MPVYVSTSCLANGNDLFAILGAYLKAGIKNVELGASHRYIEGLSAAQFESYNLNLLAHSYFPPPEEPLIVNLASQDPTILRRSRNQIKKSIEFCHGLKIDLFTFHAGFRIDPDIKLRFAHNQPVTPYDVAFETFVESVDEINSCAQKLGIKIAIENNVLSEYNMVNGRNPFLLLCEAWELEKLWREIPSGNVGMLLDLGHLKVTARRLGFDRDDFVDSIADRVFAIHTHDNDAVVDEHRPLVETSWGLEIIGRKDFSGLPIIVESHRLTIEQIVQQISLIEERLLKTNK